MRKSTPIKIIIHYPEDKQAFNKIFTEAVVTAIEQINNSVKPNKIKCK